MSADRHASPPGPEEMETLRGFLHQRLAAAVDDILGEFGRTVARYREQIDRQRRQLHGLRSEERSRTAAGLQAPSWIKPEEPDGGASPAQIKTEVVVECGAAPEPNGDFGPAGGPEGAAESSDTEDSGDYRRETAGPREPEATEEGASSAARSRTDLSERRRTPPPFGCKVCGESFRRRSRLLTHAAAHPRDCGLCGRRLEPTESLQRHLRGHEEAAFRCSVCCQSFTLRGNLRTHMRIHSGERPHGCTVCGKSFGRRATLVRHVRSHTGEKPFACAFCGRGFVEKGNLTVHLRTHTGERPYRCSGCDRRFSQRSCFYKHSCQRRGPTT